MTDENQSAELLARLRSRDLIFSDEELVIIPLCLEAANEIERMLTALQRIAYSGADGY